MKQGGRKTYVKDKAPFCQPQHDHANNVRFPTYSLDVIDIIIYHYLDYLGCIYVSCR